MVEVINYSDIVEANGKTIRENNLEKGHNIPIGSLVEVQYNEWYGNGACEKIHARLWVKEYGRDCDGTPLYTLSKYRDPFISKAILTAENCTFNNEMTLAIVNDYRKGFSEEQLTVIPLTADLIKGEGALEW